MSVPPAIRDHVRAGRRACQLRLYRDGPNCGVQLIFPAGEAWLYMGRSFQLHSRVQRQRLARTCGYVQLAYGQVPHFGLPARRTLGLQVVGRAA